MAAKDPMAFFGKEDIGKLIKDQSVPAIIGMLALSMYNVISTIYVGHEIGSLGIAGQTITFPIQIMINAVVFGIGIGTASIVSRGLGAKNV